jgi:transcriptional regulator with XRE-family HTH domain
MAQFKRENIDIFLGVVRKYMQVRGGLSQKDLAELTETGVSTISRFLNQKTSELNPQLIAKIVARLQVPMHEIIDFVEEDYTDRFIKLVKFYRDDEEGEEYRKDDEISPDEANRMRRESAIADNEDVDLDDELTKTLGYAGGSKMNAKAKVKVGGKTRIMPFETDDEGPRSNKSLREKLESLSPRQKAYMTDFLDLDMEGRDLIVDLGNNLFRYFRQKGMQL